MDLKEKVLGYKDEVVREIQNAVRVRSKRTCIARNAIWRRTC